MSRILGLDLGTNSIGWTLIENRNVVEMGVSLVPKKAITTQNVKSKRTELLTAIRKNRQLIALTTLTIFLFMMAILMPMLWQFWINLAIAGIYTILTIKRKK